MSADISHSLKCFQISADLQLEKMWQFKETESIHRVWLRDRLVFVEGERRFCIYSLFGKYMSGVQLDARISLLDTSECGYCVALLDSGELVVLGFDCNVLVRAKLVFYLGEEAKRDEIVTGLSFFNQFLTTVAVSTSAGRIFSIDLFQMMEQEDKEIAVAEGRTARNLLKEVDFPEGRQAKRVTVGKAGVAAFFNLLWLNQMGVLNVAYEQKRMG